MNPRLRLFLAVGLVSLPVVSFAEMRKWTNKAGVSIDAEMTAVDVTARTITIKMANGKEFTIPIDTLSEADRTFAAQKWREMQASPAVAPAPAPPAPGEPPAKAPTTAAEAGQPAPPRPAIAVTPASKFKVPAASDYLRVVQKTRPRLIHGAAGWNHLKSLVSTPTVAKLLENLKKSGELVLEAPELTRIFGEQRGTVTPGSKAIFRMATLGTLHFVEGDPRWKDRGVRELIAITDPATFQNWYVDEPEVTADFLIAASLGYDWFRDGLNDQQSAAVRTYMVEKGVGALVAHLKGEEVPESARGKAAGTSEPPKAKAPPKGAKKEDAADAPKGEHMAMASALILAGIALADEDPSAAKQAVDAAAKVFGKGMLQFAPAGIWPETMEMGERVLDHAILVLQTLRANSGNDMGFSTVEGLPQFGLARLHLVGPSNLLFNYGDSTGTTLTRPWVSTWLAGVHGNVGTKALTAGAPQGADSAFLGLAGHLMYYNPHAAGNGTPDSLDYVVPGNEVAALRSDWDPKAYYVALKGGNNAVPTAQLDLGSFVLDAGGQRWGIELGAETDRAPGFKPAADRTKRYELYVEGTPGQNTILIGSNQDLEAKASVAAGSSSPGLGVAVVDISETYSKAAKQILRGAMMVRGTTPYILLQDDLALKNTSNVQWAMHTRAEVSASGNKATLTQNKQTLTATILSPAGATFTAEDAPEPAVETMKKLTGIRVLKINLADVKGTQTVAVSFALGDQAATAPVKPIAEWIPKK